MVGLSVGRTFISVPHVSAGTICPIQTHNSPKQDFLHSGFHHSHDLNMWWDTNSLPTDSFQLVSYDMKCQSAEIVQPKATVRIC